MLLSGLTERVNRCRRCWANSGVCTTSYLVANNGGGHFSYDLNGCSFPSATDSSSAGDWAVFRTDSSTTTVYMNGTSFTSASDPTSGLPSVDFYISAQDQGGTAANFGNDTLAMVGFGGGLTSSQEAAKAACDDAYATSKGFNVF